MKMAKLKDMAKTPEDLTKNVSVNPTLLGQDKYPYNLRICLTHEEIEKLGADHSDWEIGDIFHLHALAKVISVSENETAEGKECRVELQITHLAGPESEDEEDEEEEHEEDEEESHERSRHLNYDE